MSVMETYGFPVDTVIAVRKVPLVGGRHDYVCFADDPFEALGGLMVALRTMAKVPGCPPDLRESLIRAASVLSGGATDRHNVDEKIRILEPDEWKP